RNEILVGNPGNLNLNVNTLCLSGGGAVAPNIAMFYDPAYVDIGATFLNEASNLKASIESFGYTVNTFTGTSSNDFAAALTGTDILVFPELEFGDFTADLAPGAATLLTDFVNNGGGLLLHGQAVSVDEDLVNLLFGTSITPGVTAGDMIRTGAAAGTAFESEVGTLPQNSGFYEWHSFSLPPGALSIYARGSATGVALLPFGSGKLVFLAWDWYNAAPVGSNDGGWISVLNAAIDELKPQTGTPMSQNHQDKTQTFGDWINTWNGGMRDRGNVFTATNTVLLKGVEMYLDIVVPTELTFFVYEGTDLNGGAFDLILQDTRNNVGHGLGWYRSTSNVVTVLEKGKSYYIGASWAGPVTYGRGSVSPVNTGFGVLESGIITTTAGNPPLPSVTLNVIPGLIPPYYQRLNTVCPTTERPIWTWPEHFTVPPGSNVPIHVIFDATTMAFGESAGKTMFVLSDDVDSPTNIVPLGFTTTLPAPIMLPEPPYTIGTSNEVYWMPINGVTTYWAEAARSTNFGLDLMTSGVLQATQHVFSALSNNLLYHYRVRAIMTGTGSPVFSPWSQTESSLQLHPDGDYDNDGIPNQWEVDNGLDPQTNADATADFDMDGVDNRSEFVADTDPFDDQSNLRILDVWQSGPDDYMIRWRGGVVSTQYLEQSTDLYSPVWQTLFTNLPDTPITNTWRYTNAPPNRVYFRIRANR
ncbi:MAG: hypothetical protein AAF492_07220, partial [Verrucomicrobiota bacterium]